MKTAVGSSVVWKQYPQSPELCARISETLQISPAIAQVLLNRDLRSIDKIVAFLNPGDPNLSEITLEQSSLEAASQLIMGHIAAQSPILVYGDYDADGVTSVSIITQALRAAGANVSYYVPDRFTEGYGLGMFILDVLETRKTKCLITLDCGISNVAEITAIKSEFEIDVIVLDHHIEPDPLPPADVILNPKRLDPDHGAHYLCTAGISYKWVSYLAKNHNFPIDPTHYLDLAAIGTIADIAPLTGENRSLTKAGLLAMARPHRSGLRHLFDLSERKTSHVTVRDIGFSIAPRINAAGRLTHAKLGVELLLAEGDAALPLAQELHHINQKRQEIGQLMVEDAIRQLDDDPSLSDCPVIALASDGWHSGVIGITAAQLCRKYSRPTILIAIRDGVGRGSARSFGTVDVHALLSQCRHLFTGFGGHKEAAGFSIPFAHISEFLATIRGVAAESINPDELVSTIMIDRSLSPQEMTLELAEAVTHLAPFGPRNDPPLFYTNQLKAVDFRPVGNGEHLKVTFSDASGKIVVDGIGFGLAKKRNQLQKPFPELVFMLEINEWQNRKLVQLNLVDIR